MSNHLTRHPEALAEIVAQKRELDQNVRGRLRDLLTRVETQVPGRKAVQEELTQILRVLDADMFNLHARMSVDAMWEMQRRLETIQAAAAPFDRTQYETPKRGPCQGEGRSLGGGGCAG